MADFLASFDLGANDDYKANDTACASVDELEHRLREIIGAKTTETRAGHVDAIVDVAESAQFSVTTTSGGDSALHAIDPSLSGVAMDVDERNETQVKTYTAMEALRNQPSQAPVVQQAVAGQIAMVVGAADKSTWVLRSRELASHGWDFTFVCEASAQSWRLQNEGKKLAVVGDYTKKEPDPVLMGRPAFDCRGRLFVSFSRKAHTISVKYNHTALHTTVAELAEFLKPPPMFGPWKPDKKTLEKSNKLAQEEAAKVRRKKYREQQKQKDGKPNEGRRKKSTKGAAQLSLADQTTQSSNHAVDPTSVPADGPNGHVSVATHEAGSGAGSAQGQAHSAAKPLSLNVTPEEAARRKEVAIKLLTEAGVSPDSLSTDQFNIFANQSPELQKESLNMLVTYGAERLQIVHPRVKESSIPAPQSDTTTTSGEAADSNAATTTTELVLEDTTPKARKGGSRPLGKSRLACFQCKDRKVKCPKERPVCTQCQTSGITCEFPPQKPRRRKPKSDTVVADATDLDAEHAEASSGGEEVEGGGEPDVSLLRVALGGDAVMTEATVNSTQQEAVQHDDDDFDSDPGAPYAYPQVPAPDSVRDSPHDPVHGLHQQTAQLPYFQSASELALPQPGILDDMPPRPQPTVELTMSGSSAYYPAYSPTSQAAEPAPAPAPEPYPEREIPPSYHRDTSNSNHRRQVPNTRTGNISSTTTWNHNNSNNNNSRNNDHNQSISTPTWSQNKSVNNRQDSTQGLPWGHVNNHNSNHALSKENKVHASPPLQHGLPDSRNPEQVVGTSHISIQDATLLTQAASHKHPYAADSGIKLHGPVPTQTSPFESAYNPRSKSQQGHRTSSLTPQRATSAYQVPPDTHSTMQSNSMRNRSSMGTDLPNPRYGMNDMTGDASSKIGYRPYAYQKSGPSANGSGYASQAYNPTLTSAGTHASLTAQVGLRPEQGMPGGQGNQQQSQHGQHSQNWQMGNQGNGYGQSRGHGYNWGIGEAWNQGH